MTSHTATGFMPKFKNRTIGSSERIVKGWTICELGDSFPGPFVLRLFILLIVYSQFTFHVLFSFGTETNNGQTVWQSKDQLIKELQLAKEVAIAKFA